MNIYEILREEHKNFKDLLDKIVTASEQGSDDWRSLLEKLKKEVIAHSRAEEAVFYNTLRNFDEGSIVVKSYGEHAIAENEMRSLSLAEKVHANLTSLMKKLSKDLKDHISREEGEVFDAARKVLSAEEANKLGEAYKKLKPEVAKDATSLTSNAIDMVSNMMPERFSSTFKRRLDSEGPAAKSNF